MAKQAPRPRRKTSRAAKVSPIVATSEEIKPDEASRESAATLAVFVYLCGDNHIAVDTQSYLSQMFAGAPLSSMHLVVQHDTPSGAGRYVLHANESVMPQRHPVQQDVNTGDPKALQEFLDWAIREVTADHYVLILSGLGINPRYVRQSLPLDSLPETLRSSRVVKNNGEFQKPDEPAYLQKFSQAVESLPAEALNDFRSAIHNRMFSVCHDFSNSGSLEITDLRRVLANVVSRWAQTKPDPRFDLVVFDVGAAAFVEVLFELEGLARIFVGSRDLIPDEGWPYQKIFAAWESLATKEAKIQKTAADDEETPQRRPLAHALAESMCEIVRNQFAEKNFSHELSAVNLETLDEVARVLDSLAVAILHSLGDWHVLDAIAQASGNGTQHATNEDALSAGDETAQGNLKWVTVNEPDASADIHELSSDEIASARKDSKALDDIEFLPAVDLFDLLDGLSQAFGKKLSSDEVPVAFGQRERLQKLLKLIRKVIDHLHSPRLARGEISNGSLLLSGPMKDGRKRGLTILLPQARSAEEVLKETGKIYSLASPSYSQLNFSRRVHWAALVGAIQMINEKPHALWRVISSMLADASSPARDAALGRLISARSVISDLRDQFKSLGSSEALTISIDPQDRNARAEHDLTRYQVRLESSIGGGVVYQQDSRVYRSSLDSTLMNLRMLLNEPTSRDDLAQQLRGLGRSLGEDVIQDLANALETERAKLTDGRDETPHLTLQLPRRLMRFPWELMNDKNGMLCERYALGRQVFMEAQFVKPIPQRSGQVIRVLVIGDPKMTPKFRAQMRRKGWEPSELLSAQAEAEAIYNLFRDLHREMAGVVEFKVTVPKDRHVSRDDMRMYLREDRFDIIHYAGHAYFDPRDPDGSAWVLSDGLLHAREIRNTLAWAKSPPWLIFANACEAGMDAAETAEFIRLRKKKQKGNVPEEFLEIEANSSDVSGLATACINQGVAAYIAPLWPVDDEIARWLSVSFYRQLLRERFSIGEALRRARCEIWGELRETGALASLPARAALTWSSFVLYGDPTARLMQSLWTPTHGTGDGTATTVVSLPLDKNGELMRKGTDRNNSPPGIRSFQQATSAQVRSVVQLPAKLVRDSSRDIVARSNEKVKPLEIQDGEIGLELAERNGVRYWRILDRGGPVNGHVISSLGEMLASEKPNDQHADTRRKLRSMIGNQRGALETLRIVKSWVLAKISGSDSNSFAAMFDQQQVPEQGLFRYKSAVDRRRFASPDESSRRSDLDTGDWNQRPLFSDQLDRALLVIHGTLSKCAPTMAEFDRQLVADARHKDGEAESLMNWMLRRYRAVLGFDHWTLSQDPKANADLLRRTLELNLKRTDREKPLELDILCLGRGGLVARSFVNSLESQGRICAKRMMFVGVPNAGSSLANPDNAGLVADLLVNLVSEDPTGLLGRLSGVLAYATARNLIGQLPGLQAMTPPKHQVGRSLINELWKQGIPEGVEHFVIASNYIPSRDKLNVVTLLKEVGDQLVDKFFGQANDLIVDTASMWSFSEQADWAEPLKDIAPENLLLFNPLQGGPSNAKSVRLAGVHHTNYLLQREVRDFIREKLDTARQT